MKNRRKEGVEATFCGLVIWKEMNLKTLGFGNI